MADNNEPNGSKNYSITPILDNAPVLVKAIVYMAQRLGVATVILLAIGYMLWRTGIWTAENVVVPIVSGYNHNVESLAETNRINTETNKVTAKAIADIQKVDERKMEKLDALMTTSATINESCRQALEDHKRFMEKMNVPK